MDQIKRYSLELLILTTVLWFFLTGSYDDINAPTQTILLKLFSISVGVLHAHIAGKLLFPTVDWDATTLAGKHYARIALYTILPFAYAFAG
jgi:nitrogen fixation-related uncharacterized protein